MRLHPARLAVPLLLSLACSHAPTAAPRTETAEESGTGPGPKKTGVAIADFCRVVATVTCDALSGCRCPTPDSASGCVVRQQAGCEQDLEPSFAGVAIEALRYDADKAEACLDAYRTELAACRNPGPTPTGTACRLAFLDAAGLGGDCATFGAGHGCAAGAGVCEPATNRCVPLPTEGALCLAGTCADGLSCDGDRCRRPESLGRTMAGESCGNHLDCASGLACVAGQCVKTVPLGEACEPDTGACGPAGLCRPPPVPRSCQPKLAAGGRCERFDDCAAGLACQSFAFPGVCVAVTPVGGFCHSETICAPGSTCAPGTNRCTLRPLLGEACLAGQCGPGLACVEQTCQLAGDVGATCWAAVQCRTGLACDRVAGACAPLRVGGESCAGGPELCEENFHCAGEDKTCRPRTPRNGACARDAECAAGLLCTGTCEPPPSTLGAPCDQVCGGDLRCAPMPGTCIGAACALAR